LDSEASSSGGSKRLRFVVLTKRPGTVALDLPITLPRGDVDTEELRDSREFSELRAQVSHAVKTAAAA
jgi:taurine transport system ATP-binding protein